MEGRKSGRRKMIEEREEIRKGEEIPGKEEWERREVKRKRKQKRVMKRDKGGKQKGDINNKKEQEIPKTEGKIR